VTRLYRETMNVDCVDFGAESSLPMLYEVDARDFVMPSDLPEGEATTYPHDRK
jgi:hypothetical protein